MGKSTSYGQFCPVARAAEIVASRWTPILLRELLAGSTRFSDLKRGVPQMSPSLLSKRLDELEDAGIIDKKRAENNKGFHYIITKSGSELAPIVMTLGIWGQKYIEEEFADHELDPTLLMWDIQRRLDLNFFDKTKRFVACFYLLGAPQERKVWWLIIKDGEVDLCIRNPGFEEDLYVEACLRSLTEIWMGQVSINEARKHSHLMLKGDDKVVKSFKNWFLLSPFAEYHGH